VDVPNPTLKLSPGMYAETEIALVGKNNALTLPSAAVVHGEGAPYVLAVDNKRVEKKTVTLGIQSPDKVEILSGVAEGETVIVSAQGNYQTGELVHAQPASISTSAGEGGQ
jgi:multidrug efflux pump subunit AcrA (membrane-fusion protein)